MNTNISQAIDLNICLHVCLILDQHLHSNTFETLTYLNTLETGVYKWMLFSKHSFIPTSLCSHKYVNSLANHTVLYRFCGRLF